MRGGRESHMKKFVWLVGGLAAAAAGFLVWNSARSKTIQGPGYDLDDDPADHFTDDPTVV
jgi:hypothetical protein